jgi:UDP-galactose transporter B1
VLAFFITTGLIMFNWKKVQQLEAENLFGVCLVLTSLLFDGLTSSQTDKEQKSSGRDFAYSLMFTNNFVQLCANIILYAITMITTGDDTLVRVFSDNQLLFDILMIALSGAIGQIFIFFTISLFDCYILTILTTTRKLFSVVISNIEFGHHFTPI